MSETKKKQRVASLRTKSVLIIVAASAILSAILVSISYHTYASTMDDHYRKLTSDLAKTAASQLDADELMRYYNEAKQLGEFDADRYKNDGKYRADFDARADALKDAEYERMMDILRDIKNANDIKYLYVQKLDGVQCTYIMDTDTSDEYCQLGIVRPIDDYSLAVEDRENGIPSYISNGDFGWLCTAMEPVKDGNGNPVALVGVDISMDKIVADRGRFLLNMVIIIGLSTIALALIIILLINKALIYPINKLSSAASSFVEDRDKTHAEGSAISRLDIRTGDEVETLSEAIKQMEKDINQYITNITAITAEKERIGAELDVATHIQSSMLPSIFPPFPDRPEFDIYATMDPAKEVGGDFYDFFMVDDRHLAVVVADVSGKGVPAALFMVIGKTLIKDHTVPGTDLSTVFADVNNLLCESNSESLFITAFEGVLDLVTGEFRFVNAGHEPPFISRAGGPFELYKIKPGFVLAGMEDMRFKGGSFDLSPGDKIFLYTDGVTEATDADERLYGMERLETALNTVVDKTPEEILPAVKADIDAFVGDAPQFDDITMLCFSYNRNGD
ncbi:MAG: PP2C family protein-serine/threonine phosphatase [Clostridia bacterium]|nr:PP2C family protein-serine/threonine phosphatase [Clostridia bacterium]